MKLPIIQTKDFSLRPYKKEDAESLAKNINNKKIYENTLNIPYPYTLKDAQEWIAENLKELKKENPSKINFVIDLNGETSGAIGFHQIEPHKAELGYWLAEKYWGRGIMTQAVKLVTKFGFQGLGLAKIYVYVFSFNKASQRVLEKANFKFEGILRKNRLKDGKLIDSHLFAKIKEKNGNL